VINSLTVKNREIVLDMLTHGPNDPMATPTKKVVTRYKLMGGNLLSEKSLRLAYLERRIKNLKSEIARIESVIPELTDLVMSLRSNIETLQRQITAIEQTHPLGFFTEEELQNYRVLVRRHNDLVDKHNALVTQVRLLLQHYKQKIAEYKRLVDEYNNLRLEVE
jgi:chromosome segregation ATPase